MFHVERQSSFRTSGYFFLPEGTRLQSGGLLALVGVELVPGLETLRDVPRGTSLLSNSRYPVLSVERNSILPILFETLLCTL
jgi:hypothetical protein